jgi:DNA excision repair protein ERCC-5
VPRCAFAHLQLTPPQRDAYYHPTVDPSEEPFKWGLPDLDALRGFLHTELGWGAAKVDELLLPVIHRAARRGQEQSRQGQLGEFFGVDAGSGTAAPRRRQAYTSKRLQQVVSDFRRQQKEAGAGEGGEDEEEEAQEEVQEAPKKRKRVRKEKDPDAPAKKAARGRGRGRGRRRGSGRGSKRRPEEDAAEASDSVSSDAGDDSAFQDGGGVPDRPLEKTLRTRSRPKPKPAYKGAQAAQEDAE